MEEALKRLGLGRVEGESIDNMLPSQFWTTASDPRTEPEKRLMVAVLEEAILLLAARVPAPSRRRRTVVDEASNWMASDDRSNLFAFASICDILGLDSDGVRQVVAALQEQCGHFRSLRLQAGRGRHRVKGVYQKRRCVG